MKAVFLVLNEKNYFAEVSYNQNSDIQEANVILV